MKRKLSITSIRLDGDTQPRKELDQLVVDEYTELYANGVDMPPVDVFFDGTDYWLADGFHRWFGARNAKLEKITCIVHTGTLEDARWFSYSANQKHGLRRTNLDKAKAVRQALKHANGSKMSDVQIGTHVGVSDKTVAKYRAEMVRRSEIPNVTTRTDSKGRKQPAKKPKSKPARGVQEWAGTSVNILTGCSHGCRYCYARENAVRRKLVDSVDAWAIPKLRPKDVEKRRKLVDGTVMFPTTHDITSDVLTDCCKAIENILKPGNRLLIVTKPHLSCITTICERFADYRDHITFRFSIGADDDELLSYWEPGAPLFQERFDCLKLAHEGFTTSVSAEPLLDSQNVRRLFDKLEPFISDTFWVGKMNDIRRRVVGASSEAINTIEHGQTDEAVRRVYEQLQDEPKVRWKDSYADVLADKQVAELDIAEPTPCRHCGCTRENELGECSLCQRPKTPHHTADGDPGDDRGVDADVATDALDGDVGDQVGDGAVDQVDRAAVAPPPPKPPAWDFSKCHYSIRRNVLDWKKVCPDSQLGQLVQMLRDIARSLVKCSDPGIYDKTAEHIDAAVDNYGGIAVAAWLEIQVERLRSENLPPASAVRAAAMEVANR